MSDSMTDDASAIIPEPAPDDLESVSLGDLDPGHPDELDADAPEVTEVAEETVTGVPVLAEARPIAPAVPAALPAVQAVAVAATGFVAGAATIALVKRHSARKLAKASRSAPRRAVDMLPIVGTRTFLVDVHLIAKPQE